MELLQFIVVKDRVNSLELVAFFDPGVLKDLTEGESLFYWNQYFGDQISQKRTQGLNFRV